MTENPYAGSPTHTWLPTSSLATLYAKQGIAARAVALTGSTRATT